MPKVWRNLIDKEKPFHTKSAEQLNSDVAEGRVGKFKSRWWKKPETVGISELTSV